MAPALLTIVAFGGFMGLLFYLTKGSILPTILAHLSLNVLLAVGGAALSSHVLWWTTVVAYSAITVMFARSRPGRARTGAPDYATN